MTKAEWLPERRTRSGLVTSHTPTYENLSRKTQAGDFMCASLSPMKAASIITISLTLLLTLGCRGQISGQSSVAEAPVEGNVPSRQDFDAYMKRDLASSLCEGTPDCHVEYSLLREGPTQTGIAYPKFYVWVTCSQGDKVVKQ